uniref:Uncharacterized protein n=1 Tax=Rhizophora mucronata TaxID=61149 RepID=A0A2P2QPF2_RHIMU
MLKFIETLFQRPWFFIKIFHLPKVSAVESYISFLFEIVSIPFDLFEK